MRVSVPAVLAEPDPVARLEESLTVTVGENEDGAVTVEAIGAALQVSVVAVVVHEKLVGNAPPPGALAVVMAAKV